MKEVVRAFGRKKITDPRDAKHLIRRQVTDRISRYWHQGQWWGDQLDRPECVGYAFAHWIEDGPVTHNTGKRPTVDPTWIYKEAQKVDEWAGEAYSGTSVRAGAKVLKALKYIKEYQWTTDLMTLANAILTRGPVVIGVWWYEGMMEPDETGFIRATGKIVGGHAVLINGVNTKSRKLRAKQSWGRAWGAAGNAFITFDDMEKLLAQDGEACLAVELTDKERLRAAQA